MLDLLAYDLPALSVAATDTFRHVVLAYLGPGAAVSTIGTFLALLAAVIVAFVGFFWYPIKRYLGRNNSQEPDAVTTPED